MKAEEKYINKLKNIIREQEKELKLNHAVIWVIIFLDLLSIIFRILGK